MINNKMMYNNRCRTLKKIKLNLNSSNNNLNRKLIMWIVFMIRREKLLDNFLTLGIN